jgi:general stress protein 26
MQDDTPSHNEVNAEEDVSGPAAAKKIADLVKAGNSCFFCTLGLGSQLHARPMTVMEVDDGGVLWFFTLFFKESDNGGHLKLDGHATQLTDRDVIHRLWSPKLRAWFTEGEDDQRICVLRVDPVSGEYWDNRHGSAIAGLKMLFGAITARRVDEGVHGHLKL